MKDYFVLFACCIPVKGATRSTICDLQRNSFELIPNTLYEILTEQEDKSIPEIYEAYNQEYNQEIKEYLDFLVSKNYGFYSQESQKFPKISLHWKNPLKITNALLDFDAQSTHELANIITQLSALYCPAVELRFFYSLDLEKLHEVIQTFNNTPIRSLQLTVGYHPDFTHHNLSMTMGKNRRVQEVIIHSTPQIDEIVQHDSDEAVIYTSQKIDSEACCGHVAPFYFTSNISKFTEAQHFNSCLNRKISVDKRGYIKNCPSMTKTFGHIDDTPLKQVIENTAFQKLWQVTKDKVLTCQDCEFRYICHDCRAYVADPDNALSKPAKCNYNPYEARWENEAIATF